MPVEVVKRSGASPGSAASGRRRVGISVRCDPDLHVGNSEREVFPESMRRRAEPAGSPVVHGGDGYAEVRGDFPDIHQLF